MFYRVLGDIHSTTCWSVREVVYCVCVLEQREHVSGWAQEQLCLCNSLPVTQLVVLYPEQLVLHLTRCTRSIKRKRLAN